MKKFNLDLDNEKKEAIRQQCITIWNNMRRWWKNTRPGRQKFYLFGLIGMLAFSFFMIMHARSYQTPGITENKLNHFQQVKNSNVNVAIESRKYNPKNSLMLLQFSSAKDMGNADQLMTTGREVKFEIRTKRPEPHAKIQIIPTFDHWAVAISGLKPGWHAMQIKVLNHQPKNLSKQGQMSGTNSNQDAVFYVLELPHNNDYSLNKESNSHYAADSVRMTIKSEHQAQARWKNDIKKDQETIDYDREQIDSFNSDNSYKTKKQNLQAKNTVKDYKNSLNSAKQDIKAKRKNIRKSSQDLVKLHAQLYAINHHEYHYPSPIHQTKILMRKQTKK